MSKLSKMSKRVEEYCRTSRKSRDARRKKEKSSFCRSPRRIFHRQRHQHNHSTINTVWRQNTASTSLRFTTKRAPALCSTLRNRPRLLPFERAQQPLKQVKRRRDWRPQHTVQQRRADNAQCRSHRHQVWRMKPQQLAKSNTEGACGLRSQAEPNALACGRHAAKATPP